MEHPLARSDKFYWHRYLSFYEQELTGLECAAVLEFGIWQGASIRWLLSRYPAAKIFGADILPVQQSWPQSANVEYFTVDQGDRAQLRACFNAIGGTLDLVIDDGSHIPEHQCSCLVEAVPHIRRGGIYILEDIHTSHPSHPYYRKSKRPFRPLLGALQTLLAIDHLKRTFESAVRVDEKLEDLTHGSPLNSAEVALLFDSIESVNIYRRTDLPDRCWSCGSADFDYGRLRCKCGQRLYAEADSMTALIRIR